MAGTLNLPRAHLFGNPNRTLGTISPDGSRLAWAWAWAWAWAVAVAVAVGVVDPDRVAIMSRCRCWKATHPARDRRG